MDDSISLLRNEEQEILDDFSGWDPNVEIRSLNEQDEQESDSEGNLNSNGLQIYIQEIIESFMKIVVMFYVVTGFLFAISRSASMLTPARFEKNKDAFYPICFYMVCFLNVIILIMVAYNRYFNRHCFHNLLTGDHWTYLYVIIIPLGVLSSLNILINVLISCSNDVSPIFFLSEYGLLFSVILIGFFQVKKDSNVWLPNTLDTFTKTLVVVGCIVAYFYNMFTRCSYQLRYLASVYFNVSFHSCLNNHKDQVLWYINTHILSLATSSFVLFAGAYIATISYQPNRVSVLNRNLCNINANTLSFALIVLISSLTLTPVIFLGVSDGTLKKKEIALLLSQSSICVIYLCGIASSVMKIKEIGKWERIKNIKVESNTFDRIFIWAGFFGQMMSCARIIGYAIHQITTYHQTGMMLGGFSMVFIVSLCRIFETIFQTYLIELSFDRKWERYRQTEPKPLYSSLILTIVNLGCLVNGIYEDELYAKLRRNHSLLVDLFLMYTTFFPKTLINVQRLHGIIFFGKLYLNTEKEDCNNNADLVTSDHT